MNICLLKKGRRGYSNFDYFFQLKYSIDPVDLRILWKEILLQYHFSATCIFIFLFIQSRSLSLQIVVSCEIKSWILIGNNLVE